MKSIGLLQYIVLMAMLAGGSYAFWMVRSNPALQFLVGVIVSVSYALWGIMYHAFKKDLHIRVVIEYMLIAIVGIIILNTVLL